MNIRTTRQLLKKSVSMILAAGFLVSGFHVCAANNKDKLETRYSVMSMKAHTSLLTDVIVVGDKLVVVGERGHILHSSDHGQTWKQAKVPTQNLLTAVYFSSPMNGWAVGHEAVVLHTSDGGENWVVQYGDPYDKTAEVDYDSPDRSGQPLLDVWFKNDKEGFAVGAYGRFIYTKNGGETWEDYSSKIDNIDGWHLNAIASNDSKTVYIAGESGTLFRSSDGGMSWERLESPYEGSYFGIVPGPGVNELLVFGLQGHIFRSSDRGENWVEIETDNNNGLMAGTLIGYRGVVLVGNSGVIMSSNDDGNSFVKQTTADRQSLVGIATTSKNKLIMVGKNGVKIAMPNVNHK